MITGYWSRLAGPFRLFISRSGESGEVDALSRWTRQVFDVGERVLIAATDEAGDRGEALRQRAQALNTYRIARAQKAKEWKA